MPLPEQLRRARGIGRGSHDPQNLMGPLIAPRLSYATICTGWAKKLDHFLKCITFSYNDIGRRSIYQNFQLFIRSKTDILNVTIFKYTLRTFGETILHRKTN